jgi:hypothetical protein
MHSYEIEDAESLLFQKSVVFFQEAVAAMIRKERRIVWYKFISI